MSSRTKLSAFTRPSGRSRKVTPTNTTTIAPVAQEVEKDTPESMLRQLAPSMGLQEDQIKELVSLRYPNNSSVLSLDKIDVFYEIIGFLRMRPYEEVVEYLREVLREEDVITNLPTLQSSRDKIMVNLYLLLQREIGVKGVERCKRCGSNEVVFAEKQTRSADEPTTVFIRCVQCGNRWRQ